MRYQIEFTDTFAGEANYGWVKRAQFEAPEDASNSLLIRRAKKALGLVGKHKTSSYGDVVELKWARACVVAFITPANA